jgi:putative tryptophan/tyrosine transport system substrate-binding protein
LLPASGTSRPAPVRPRGRVAVTLAGVTVLRGIFTASLAIALTCDLPAGEAQPATKVPRVGVLRPGSSPDPYADVFRQSLRDLGYIEPQTVVLEYRWAEGQPAQLPRLAADLVQLGVDVIVTQGEESTRAVKAATSTIPIVMATSGDPVGSGLVTSLARPGGNVTGLSAISPDLVGKQLQLLKEAVPKVSRVAILSVPDNVAMAHSVKEAQGAARALGLTVKPRYVRAPEELGPTFDAMTRDRAEALVMFADAFSITHQRRILELAAKHRLPTICALRESADCLLIYGTDRVDMFRRAAVYLDKILKGAKPADLPVAQPVRFELVVNLKTAKLLGVTIPRSVLSRADHLIQ